MRSEHRLDQAYSWPEGGGGEGSLQQKPNEGEKRRNSYRGDFRSDGLNDKQTVVAVHGVILDFTEPSARVSGVLECLLESKCQIDRVRGNVKFPRISALGDKDSRADNFHSKVAKEVISCEN